MTQYRPDDPWVVCQRTGRKTRASQTVIEWTGLRVRRESCDPKHPSLDLPHPVGEEVIDHPTGRPRDLLVGNTLAELLPTYPRSG